MIRTMVVFKVRCGASILVVKLVVVMVVCVAATVTVDEKKLLIEL